MKKTKTMRIAVLMLALTLLTCCFVGSTFARYTSTYTATENDVTVAKWAFEMDNQALTSTFDFDLFNKAKVYELDSSGNLKKEGENFVDDTDIINGRDDKTLIAPGCGGTVSVVLENLSEVTAQYKVEYTANEADIPLEWSADNATWTNNPTNIDFADATKLDAQTGTATITLYYRWAFEGGVSTADPDDGWTDADDTDLGIAGNAVPSITVTVTVQQVD